MITLNPIPNRKTTPAAMASVSIMARFLGLAKGCIVGEVWIGRETKKFRT
jgi:hypothetical protein